MTDRFSVNAKLDAMLAGETYFFLIEISLP